MLTFENILELFQEYLLRDPEEEVLPCKRGYVRLTWNKDSRYCVDGILCRTPEELFDLLLTDYQDFELLRRTKGRREVTEADEKAVEELCQPYLDWRNESCTVYFEIGAENPGCAGGAGADAVHLGMLRPAVCVQLHLRPGLHGGGAAGDRGAGDLLAAKRRDPAGDRLSGQPAGPSDGRRLAGGQGAGPSVCNPGRGVRLNRKCRIAGSEGPAIF